MLAEIQFTTCLMLFIFLPVRIATGHLLNGGVIDLRLLVWISFTSGLTTPLFNLLSNVTLRLIALSWNLMALASCTCTACPLVCSYWYLCLVKVSLINFSLLTLFFGRLFNRLVFIWNTLVDRGSIWHPWQLSLISSPDTQRLLLYFVYAN